MYELIFRLFASFLKLPPAQTMAGNFFCMKTTMNPQTLPEYIKPGSFVKLRDGSKARIYATDGGPKPYNVHGAIWQETHWNPREWAGCQYTIEPNHYRDIIGPWIDKPNCDKLWPLLPPWIKYLAMDKDYGWFAYTLKPSLGDFHAWNVIGNEYYFKIPSEHVPIYSGDWKDSLVERPE